MAKASDFESEDWGFESLRGRISFYKIFFEKLSKQKAAYPLSVQPAPSQDSAVQVVFPQVTEFKSAQSEHFTMFMSC